MFQIAVRIKATHNFLSSSSLLKDVTPPFTFTSYKIQTETSPVFGLLTKCTKYKSQGHVLFLQSMTMMYQQRKQN